MQLNRSVLKGGCGVCYPEHSCHTGSFQSILTMSLHRMRLLSRSERHDGGMIACFVLPFLVPCGIALPQSNGHDKDLHLRDTELLGPQLRTRYKISQGSNVCLQTVWLQCPCSLAMHVIPLQMHCYM